MQLDDAWPAVVEAFGHYGKRITPRLRGARRKLVERLLLEYEPDELVAAVHGYCVFHQGLDREPGSEFDPRKYFTPESVFRWEKIESRVELGLDGPYRKPLSHEEQVKARQDAARQRVAAARAAKEGQQLRAV